MEYRTYLYLEIWLQISLLIQKCIILGFQALLAHLIFQLAVQNLMTIEFCKRQIFENLSINLPWGHVRSLKKLGPDQFSRFDVYWKQTNRKAKYIYRLIISCMYEGILV